MDFRQDLNKQRLEDWYIRDNEEARLYRYFALAIWEFCLGLAFIGTCIKCDIMQVPDPISDKIRIVFDPLPIGGSHEEHDYTWASEHDHLMNFLGGAAAVAGTLVVVILLYLIARFLIERLMYRADKKYGTQSARAKWTKVFLAFVLAALFFAVNIGASAFGAHFSAKYEWVPDGSGHRKLELSESWKAARAAEEAAVRREQIASESKTLQVSEYYRIMIPKDAEKTGENEYAFELDGDRIAVSFGTYRIMGTFPDAVFHSAYGDSKENSSWIRDRWGQTDVLVVEEADATSYWWRDDAYQTVCHLKVSGENYLKHAERMLERVVSADQ